MLNNGVSRANKRNILKISIATLFVVVSSFVSILTVGTEDTQAAPLITRPECESAGGTYIPGNPNRSTECQFNYTPDNQIRSYSYYTALSQCARMGQWQQQIPQASLDDTSKWIGGANISVGYLVDTADGIQECNKILNSALSLWGFTGSKENALETFGYKKTELPVYGNCTPGVSSAGCTQSGTEIKWTRNSDESVFLKAFQDGVKGRLGGEPTLEGKPDLLYRRGIYHIEYSSACNAKPFKKVSDLTADERTRYPNNNDAASGSEFRKDYLIVKLVNGSNWQTEDWVYTLVTENWSKQIKLNEKPSGGSVDSTCVAIAKDMAGYANRVRDDAASMIAMGQDPSTKYASIISTPGNNGSTDSPVDGSGGAADNIETTCAVDGVGWILCPVMNFMANIVDAAYSFVAGLLQVQPLLTTGNSQGVYDAWVVMRNIANVAFVIVFIIIIFSQLTSLGVSNYGVKKLLPRLVVAAILVNISYWICAAAVDLSNIAGTSMNAIFSSISAGIPDGPNTASIAATGEGWIGIVGGVLAGAAGVVGIYYIGLSALIPALLAALVSIVTVFLVLTLRQALIILLVAIAPLAFVAYLLPNTENLFTSWRKLLTTLLLMYPIIAAIFGASALASEIVMQSASGDYKIAVQVMGALIAILPLALTPIVMRVAGGVLNRFGGIVNNTEKGPVDRLRKVGEKYREGRLNLRRAQALNGAGQLGRGGLVRWRARRQRIYEGRDAEAKEAYRDYTAKELGNKDNPGFATAVAAGDVEKGRRLAVKAEAHIEAEDLKEALLPLMRELAGMDPGQKSKYLDKEIAEGGSRRDAALHYAAQIGDTSYLRKYIASGDDETVRATRAAINANPSAVIGKAPDLVKGEGAAFGSVKGADLAQFKPDTAEAYVDYLTRMHTAATTAGPGSKEAEKYKIAIDGFNSAVEDIKRSPELQAAFGGEAGTMLRVKTASTGPGAAIAGDVSGAISSIQSDGKIR
jgi:hypothetical protein